MSKSILLVGATGFVGGKILNLIDDGNSKITLLSRKKLNHKSNLKQIITNFDGIDERQSEYNYDEVYIAIGKKLSLLELLYIKKEDRNSFKQVDLEYIKKGEKEFIDERGKISNFELPEPVNLVGYIDSKKGTVRANHYHPIQEQKVLLIKGQFISIYKDLVDDKSVKVTHVVNEGDMIVTQPNVAHTMVFLEDSVLLNLVNGEREHENYGVTHTIKHLFVDEKEKDLLLKLTK